MRTSFTKAEEQIMRYLWKLEKAFFKDLKAQFPDPKPATTTINTLLARMIEKGFISYQVYGNSREYYPLIKKKDYIKGQLNNMIKNFFNNSSEQFASFYTNEADLSEDELKKLREIVDNQLKSK